MKLGKRLFCTEWRRWSPTSLSEWVNILNSLSIAEYDHQEELIRPFKVVNLIDTVGYMPCL